MKPLHKRFKDYTSDEINEIVNSKCINCKYSRYLNGYAYSDELKNKNRSCNFLVNTGHRRIVRPDLCPYYEEDAVVDYSKFADFDTYCPRCKYRDLDENTKPCNECLACPARNKDHRPAKFKYREEK